MIFILIEFVIIFENKISEWQLKTVLHNPINTYQFIEQV